VVKKDYVIRVLKSPLDVDAAEWNALLAAQNPHEAANPFMRHEYLAAMHESKSAVTKTGWTPRFFTLWQDKTLAGACALYLKTNSYGEYVFDWAWANAYAEHGLDYYPKALIAPPFTPVPGARLLARSADERVLLVQAVIAWCTEEKLSSLHLLFASDDDLAACEEAGLMLRHNVQFHWSNVAPRRLLGSDANFAAVRSTAPSGRAFSSANLDSDPKNRLPPEGALRLRHGEAGSAAPAGEYGARTLPLSHSLAPGGAAAPAVWQSQLRGPGSLENASRSLASYRSMPAGADAAPGGADSWDLTDPALRPLSPGEGGGEGSASSFGYRDFDDFLMSLSQDKRKKIRQERRKVADAGIAFRWALGTDISDADWDFFYRCYERTYYEHGNAPYLTRDFFRRMQRTMPENWLLFVAEHTAESGERQAVACSLIAVSGAGEAKERVAYGRYWGALARVDCLHFEACYYQPLAWCIEHGFARFEGGAQGEHKMARALLPVKTTSAHWLAHPSFADAVERFLEREGAGIDGYLQQLEKRSPMKQATPGDAACNPDTLSIK
jgi:uncharacterized protein